MFEDPELKQKYDKYKYTVKLWEHQFFKKFNRIPSKLDIKEASNDVRYAYKKYFELKTAALEQSFVGVEGFEESSSQEEQHHEPIQSTEENNHVNTDQENNTILESNKKLEESQSEVSNDKIWGEHLNKNFPKPDKNNKELTSDKQMLSKPVQSITKKLFCGSKFNKRNPRKSLQSSSNKKTTAISTTTTSGTGTAPPQQEDSLLGVFDSEEALVLWQQEMHQQSTTTSASSQIQPLESLLDSSIDIVDSIFAATQSKTSVMKTIDVDWLDRVSRNIGVRLEDFQSSTSIPTKEDDSDDEDVIEDSDEESESYGKLGNFHISKKIKTSATDSSDALSFEGKIISKTNDSSKKEITQQDTQNVVTEPPPYMPPPSQPEIKVSKIKNGRKRTTKLSKKPAATKKTPPEKTKSQPTRRSSRSNKVKVSFEEFHSDEDPFYTDDEDPEFTYSDNTPPPEDEDLKKQEKPKKKSNGAVQTEDNDAKYELEFTTKQRPIIPRIDNMKKLIHDKTKKETNVTKDNTINKAKEKLENKVANGTLNDNYVTLNMKKKIFVKGKKNFNFSKMKKMKWKNKKKALYGPNMDMRGCDGGKLVCFNCGKEGHFAQNCTNNKGDQLLPKTTNENNEDDVDDDCSIPTLQEASKMANESVFNVRSSSRGFSQSENSTQQHNLNDEWGEDDDLEQQLIEETLKLEEYAKQIDMNEYIDSVKVIEHYFPLKDNGDLIETPIEINETLKKFGHDTFRPGQEKAIMRILSGKSTLVTLSTGSGKSLCYQLPAYLYSQKTQCITLVISPLVSLMEDQISGIPKFLKAACLHTNQTKVQRQKVVDALTEGKISVLLISPETLVTGEKQSGFGSILRKLPPIAFACVDEVHCISQWSHNFRPSYLMISRVLKEHLGVRTILGLTATATRSTAENIIRLLDVPDGFDGIIHDVPLPDNLYLTVSKDANKDRALIKLLLDDKMKNCDSIIVYCTRRDECERVASFLRISLKHETVVENNNKKRKRLSLEAEPYHAGLSATNRKSIQNAFMNGNLRVIVATVAFGMGIDKSNIRAVIHYNMPKNFESYVQEIGRAGRDGLPAYCHVFVDPKGSDERELARHIYANSVDRYVIRKLLQKVFTSCSCKNYCPKHEVAFSIEETIRALDIPEENISTLLCYLQLHQNKYIEILNPAYIHCKIISYNGRSEIYKAAKECPPLAMALALYESNGLEGNILEFPIIELASIMGWDSGICKHKLKNLEWTTKDNKPKRSFLNVEFSNLGFRLLAPGNLTDDQLDEALDILYNIIIEQETTSLKQLQAVHQTLTDIVKKENSTNAEENCNILKHKIREYFIAENPLENIVPISSSPKIDEERLVNDIQSIISMYRDNQFTARSLTRIFHGIPSPNYPAVIWGRCKYWRSHLHEDFNEIYKIASKEILRFR